MENQQGNQTPLEDLRKSTEIDELKERFIKEFCIDETDTITGRIVMVMKLGVVFNPLIIFKWFMDNIKIINN